MAKDSVPDRGETSISKSICETVNGSHRYEIKGFSLAKGMGTGKYIASDTFTVGGYQWAVYFYPDGKNPEDNSAHVSVFVALASEGTDVRALFELTLVDQSGKGKHKVHSHFDRALVSGPYTLKYRGSMWGYKRFYRRTALETSDYLKNDCIIMTCTVGVVRNRIETPRQLSIPAPPSDMGCCLEGLLKSGIGADIQFDVRDESFKAHKLILAARSPVFKAQFFGPIGNPDVNKIVVEDVEPLVFKAMLMFMYSDLLPDVHELTGSASMSMSTNIAQHLLAAADRYGLERLKILCEAKLSEQVTADTVASTLALAEQHHCHHLKSVCLKFTAAPENLRVAGRNPLPSPPIARPPPLQLHPEHLVILSLSPDRPVEPSYPIVISTSRPRPPPPPSPRRPPCCPCCSSCPRLHRTATNTCCCYPAVASPRHHTSTLQSSTSPLLSSPASRRSSLTALDHCNPLSPLLHLLALPSTHVCNPVAG